MIVSAFYLILSLGPFAHSQKVMRPEALKAAFVTKDSSRPVYLKDTMHNSKVRINYNMPSSNRADSGYKELRNLLDQLKFHYPELKASDDTVSLRASRYSKNEKIYNEYKALGLKLWHEYPNDNRKFGWLQITIETGWLYLQYWKNIDSGSLSYYKRPSVSSSYTSAIDWSELTAWEKVYPDLKRELFKYFSISPPNTSEREYSINVRELEQFLRLSLNSEYRKRDGNNKMDLALLKELMINASRELGLLDSTRNDWMVLTSKIYRTLDNDFISVYRSLGVSDADLWSLLNDFAHVDDPLLKGWAIQRKTLLKLYTEPFSLKCKAIDGREIDLKKMRGKVVLVDFWSTWCSSCIERMPMIKKVYDKYRSLGFEVVSACLNSNDKLEEVKKIEEKVGATWPTLLIGSYSDKDSLGRKIFDKFGFFGVPQLLLINKEGKLVLINGVLRDGDFEKELLKLL